MYVGLQPQAPAELGQGADDVDQGVGRPPHDAPLPQGLQELLRPLEVRHLDVGGAQLPGRVGVAAGAHGQPQLLGQAPRPLVVAPERGAGVEHLYDVQVGQDALAGVVAQGLPPDAVEGVRQRYQASLGLHPLDGLLRRQARRDGLLQEEPGQLAVRGLDLLGDDDLEGGDALDGQGPLDVVVLGDGEAVDAQLQAAAHAPLGRGDAVPRVVGMDMEVGLQQGSSPGSSGSGGAL